MSDFLNKFSKDAYDKKNETSTSPKQPAVNTELSKETKAINQEVQKHSKNEKNTDMQHEEVFEYDAESKKRRKKRLIIISSISVFVLIVASVFIYLSGNIKVPDFVNGQSSDAKIWGVQKGVFIELEEEFSLKFDSGVVFEQEPKGKSTVRKGDSVKLRVSKGADPEEVIALPDFSKMKKSEIEAWIKEKRVDNASITLEFSDTIEKDMFIKKAFRNANVTETSYRRKDVLTITVSKGKEEFEKNIKVSDFIGKSQQEVSAWADTNKVTLDVTEVYSDTVPMGNVVSQSFSAGTMISKVDTLSINVSKGKATIVPDFGGLSKEQAQARASSAGVSVSIEDLYNGSVGFGSLISQSIGSGTILSNPSTAVTLYYSLGVPFVPDLAGKSVQESVQLLSTMNNQGANISYNIVETNDNSVAPGIVIMNDSVGHSGFGLRTVLKVSAGGQVQIPTSQLLGKVYESEEVKQVVTDLQARGLKVVVMYYSTNAKIDGRPVVSGEIAELTVLEGTIRRFLNHNEVLNTGSQVLQIVIQK